MSDFQSVGKETRYKWSQFPETRGSFSSKPKEQFNFIYLSESIDILGDGSVCQRKISNEELRDAGGFPVGK